MRTIEIKGKTVEDAILAGLQELGLSRERVEIEILDAGSRGFLGFGSRLAKVRLTENQEEKISFADLITNDLDLSLETKKEKVKPPKPRKPKKQEKKAEKPREKAKEQIEEKTKPIQEKAKPIREKTEELVQPFALDGEKISPKLKRTGQRPEKRAERKPLRIRDSRASESFERRPRARRQTSYSNVTEETWPIPEDESGLTAYNFAQEIIDTMKLDCRVNVRSDKDEIYVDLTGDANDLGVLIGKRGVTLDAFQYLLNVVVNKEKEERVRVSLNVGDYRQRREKTLIRLAERLAGEVVEKGRPRALEPMTPRERRLIHMALQEFEGVYTESRGESNQRHIVIYKE